MTSPDMDITPYRLNVPQPALDDLHRRLADTRWPAALPGDDWDYGVPTWYLKRLAAAWRDQFDWRGAEAKLNTYPQFTSAIDGTTVHFVHARSPHENALPLLLTHGWPGSVFASGSSHRPRPSRGRPRQRLERFRPAQRRQRAHELR